MPSASTLDNVRAALKKPNLTAASLATIVDQTIAVASAATETLLTARAKLDENPLASSADRAKDRDAAAAAHLAEQDAAVVLAEAQRQHAEAIAAETDRERTATYESARAMADEAATALRKQYPKLCRDMMALLRQLAEAQIAVNAANAALPTGALMLADPEHVARGTPGLPREIVSVEHVELWGRFDLDTPVDEAFQGEIYEVGNGWGKRGNYETGSASMGEPQAAYRKRVFKKVTTQEGVNDSIPTPLAATLTLPALRGNHMAWGDDFPVFNPALGATLAGRGEPQNVLAQLAEKEAAAATSAAKPQRRVTVEWASHTDVVPLPAPVLMDTAKAHVRSSQPFAKHRAAAFGRRSA